jgi:hypothetical protein
MNAPSAPQGTLTKILAPFYDESKIQPVTTCWMAFYNHGTDGTRIFSPDDDEIEIDITRAGRKRAKLVKRAGNVGRLLGTNQKNVELGNYTSVSRNYPLSIEEFDIGADKLRKRIPGEPGVDSGRTGQFRLRHWAAKGQRELSVRQVRMMNLLAGQSILEGVMDAFEGATSTDQYDFYRNSDNSITLGTQWTNASAGTPLDDLDDAIDIAIVNGNAKPDFALMGQSAIRAFNNSDQVTDKADNRTFESFIAIGPNETAPSKYSYLTQNGWEARGQIHTDKGRSLWVFTTEQIYDTDADVSTPYMPLGKVVLGNTDARCDDYYGPSETFPETPSQFRWYQEMFGTLPSVTAPEGTPGGILDPRMFYADAYQNKQRSLVTTRVQSAPLYAPVETDKWVVIENAA